MAIYATTPLMCEKQLNNKFKQPLKTPTVIQAMSSECGSACICIVLGYFGRWIPLEKMRLACAIDQKGVSVFNILQAAKKYGMIGQAFRKEAQDLLNSECPAILYWKLRHYVVLEGIQDGRFFINNPLRGHYSLSLDEFNRDYSKVVIIFTLSETFFPEGTPPSRIKNLVGFVKGICRYVLGL